MVEIVKILERVAEIEIKNKMNLETLRAEQNKLISIDHELRELRKNSTYRVTINKCTEILHRISYAVSIYLPKERKIGISLVKEAVEYLKLQTECLKFWKDPEELRESYESQRKNLFNEIKVNETERYKVNKEISKEGFPEKKHAELLNKMQEIVQNTDALFDELDKLAQDFGMQIETMRQKDKSYKQTALMQTNFSVCAVAIEA
ncbi:MAG: hypothetical protein ABFD07_00310 [Methanobacterium sp.]